MKENEKLNNKFNDSKTLASYMAGLIESDGMIGIDKKGTYVKIKITFHKNDLPFAEFLKKKFNMGRIYHAKTNAIDWRISTQTDVLNMLSFINGHLRTAKIVTLKKALSVFKNRYDIEIPCLPLNTTPFLEDSWFAGFSEGDSCFFVECSKIIKKISIRPTYKLEVAKDYIKLESEYDNYRSNRLFMEPLAKVFGSNLIESTKKARPEAGFKETYSIILKLTNFPNLEQLIEYFSKNLLISSKFLNFEDFKTIHKIKQKAKNEGKQLKEIFPEILKIKNGMNSKRIYFNWDHLETNFPNIPSDFPNYTIQLWKRRK